jgi:hypothetical protein
MDSLHNRMVGTRAVRGVAGTTCRQMCQLQGMDWFSNVGYDLRKCPAYNSCIWQLQA